MSRAAPEIQIDLTPYATLKAEHGAAIQVIKDTTREELKKDERYLALTTAKQQQQYFEGELHLALTFSEIPSLPYLQLARQAQDAIAKTLLKDDSANYEQLKFSAENFPASALLACLAMPELIKNCVDAHATTATIVLDNNETLIIDNGEGITDPKILAQCDDSGFCDYSAIPTDDVARIASTKTGDASKTGGAGAGLAINNRVLTDNSLIVALAGRLLIGKNISNGATIKFQTSQETTFSAIHTKYQIVKASMEDAKKSDLANPTPSMKGLPQRKKPAQPPIGSSPLTSGMTPSPPTRAGGAKGVSAAAKRGQKRDVGADQARSASAAPKVSWSVAHRKPRKPRKPRKLRPVIPSIFATVPPIAPPSSAESSAKEAVDTSGDTQTHKKQRR
ncbi:MAG: ATP-binding protein [Coxiellaceae bacterium]|nr:ATP-binding protein [Coxiellaceae bacterium]